MTGRDRLLCGLCFAGLTLTGATAMAAGERPLSIHELTDRARLIVVGRATARETLWIGRELATLVSITVGETFKGTPATMVTVAMPGGIDRRRKAPVEMVYVGAPQIAAGEEVLLFLEHGDARLFGTFVVAGGFQGKLSIIKDRAGERRVGHRRLSDFRNDISRRVRESTF